MMRKVLKENSKLIYIFEWIKKSYSFLKMRMNLFSVEDLLRNDLHFSTKLSAFLIKSFDWGKYIWAPRYISDDFDLFSIPT